MTENTAAENALAVLQDIANDCEAALLDAPKRPEPTCPDIDQALRWLKAASKEICAAHDLLKANGLESPFWPSHPDTDVREVAIALEDLRAANSDLRENGTWFYKTVERCEGEAKAALRALEVGKHA